MQPLSDEDYLRYLTGLCAGADELDLDGMRGMDGLFSDACADDLATIDGLIDYAGQVKLGFMLNHGWRCDVSFDKVSIEVIDRTFPAAQHFDIRAVTAFGALAAGILAALQNRAKAGHHPLYEASFKLLSGDAGGNLGFAEFKEGMGRSLTSFERDAFFEIRGGLLAILKQPDTGQMTSDEVKDRLVSWWRAQHHPLEQRFTVVQDRDDPSRLTVSLSPPSESDPADTSGDC